MLAILAVILPVFLLICFGFAVGRTGFLSSEQVLGLGRYVIAIALPALIFQSLQARSFGEIIHLDYLGVYTAASLCAFAAVFFFFRLQGVGQARSAVRAYGAACSNAGLLGLPILLQLFGPAGAIPVALNMLVENVVTTPLALSLLHASQHSGAGRGRIARNILANLIRTPLVIAIAAGMMFSIAGLDLPGIFARAVAFLAASAAPVALVAIGAGLRNASLRGAKLPVAVITAGKLVLHPFAAWCLLLVLPIANPELRMACVLLAGMPMVSIFPLIAQRADDQEVCGSALLAATALSVVTLPFLIWMTGAIAYVH